ncbi:MAG: ribosomal protein L7/L12 [Dehalococcoidia bacterium]|nr:ribosomal protein L7/L12 [Dehalococcoidia bacterium]
MTLYIVVGLVVLAAGGFVVRKLSSCDAAAGRSLRAPGTGAAARQLSSEDDVRRIHELLQGGDKIAAIKVYRERTGAGLKDAKDAVEALERGEPLPPGDDEPAARPAGDAVDVLILAGKKIEAIRQYREEHPGTGLNDAKDAVEARERELGGRA